jgi:Predicted NADH:ubiquinone oxidoreductase, subunit RnfC
MGNFYPAGDEVIMIADLIGRTVPEGGLPLQVGVVVNNPETLLSVADALEGTPVTHKLVTVGGCCGKSRDLARSHRYPHCGFTEGRRRPDDPEPRVLGWRPHDGKVFPSTGLFGGQGHKGGAGCPAIPRWSFMK